MQIKRIVGTVWMAYEDGRGILIDAGMAAQKRTILRKISKLGIDVPLLFLTHTHYDHTGCARAVQKATGAKVIVGAREAQYLRSGHTVVPRGTGFFSRMIGRAGHDIDAKHFEYYDAIPQDVIEIGEVTALSEFGFDATAIPLGAHSAGSIGLQIGEHFFVGDVVFGLGHVIYPMFADFEQDIAAAWNIILGSGTKYIYPGHGRRLDAAYLQKIFDRRFGTK